MPSPVASSRLPGPICASQQPPVDFRTSQLAPTPPPGPVGANARESCLDAADIESLELFEKSLKYRSLEELQYLRFKNEQLYEQAVRDAGARSSRATFWTNSIAILDTYIAVSGSAYGKAKKTLEDLTDALKNGAPVKDDDVRKAVAALRDARRRILLIDDSKLVHNHLGPPLRDKGYELFQAFDGEEAPAPPQPARPRPP